MFKMTALLLGFVLLLLTGVQSKAESVTTTIHHQYQSARPLGMGDAFVAVANDYNALFYNPAGLARLKTWQFNGSLGLGVTTGVSSFFTDFSDIANSTKTDAQKQLAYLQLIQNHYGDVFSTRFNLLEGVWVHQNWAVGFVPADVSLEMSMHQLVGPSINTTVYADSTLAMGYAEDLKEFKYGQLSWGVTGKFVNRGYFSKSITAVDLASSSNIVSQSDLLEGYTIDADVGVLWTPELPETGFLSNLKVAKPTFGAVMRNVAELGFGQSLKLLNKKEQNGTPEKLYRVIDLGSRWEYPEFWIFGGRGVLDFRDILHPDYSLTKSMHLGFEFDWTVFSWWKGAWRVGLNQGFWTAGMSAELTWFNLDLVSYADDVGSKDKPIESRVYALKMNLDF